MNKQNGLHGIVVICVCVLTLTGCAALKDLWSSRESGGKEDVSSSSQASEESQAPSQQESIPTPPAKEEGSVSSSSSTSNAESETTEPEENMEDNTMERFVTTLTDTDGKALTGTVEFSIEFPENWTVSDNLVYDAEGRQVAEILPSIPFEDESIFDKLAEQYPDSDPITVTVGGLTGRCFYYQTPVDDPAFAGRFNNELYYYLEKGNDLICIRFTPALGVGIGTQREEFQADIKAIK